MAKEELFTQCVNMLHHYEDSNGMRHTQEREYILRAIVNHSGAFTPKELCAWVVDEHISRATIYNTLNHFLSAQILHCLRQQTDSKRIQYELALVPTNHIQIKCIRCGRVSEIKDPAIKKIIFDRRFSNFSASHFSLYVYGVCRICRKLNKCK